ncbi:jg6624, partial [Pararge aegeria aegeria]
RNDVSIERLVVQGKVEGTRARGRSPMRWTDQVKATIEEKSGEVLSSEPQNPDDDHDQSVKTETTKKKKNNK